MERKLPKTLKDFYHYYCGFDDWAVNFTNNMELSVEMVKQYFSKYGNIKQVRQTGSSTGYCFVHFDSEENAKKCALDMKNSDDIRLRPFDPNIFKKFAKKSNINEDYQEKKSSRRHQNDQRNIENANSMFFDEKSANNRNYDEIVSDNLVKFESADCNANNLQSEDVNLSVYGEIMSLEDNEKFLGEKLGYVTAEEIIVANIPDICGVNYFLELFKNYEPICATNVRINEKNSMRYCHIYFKTIADAKAIEFNYDNVEVYGKNLIVLRRETLIADLLSE